MIGAISSIAAPFPYAGTVFPASGAQSQTAGAPQPSTGVTTPQDTVTISGQQPTAGTTANTASQGTQPGQTAGTSGTSGTSNTSGQTGSKDSGSAAQPKGADGSNLTPDQLAEVAKLKQTDRHVRQHEAAHQAAGGSLAGAATFTYITGPDGQRYAVGGEVPISIPSASSSNPQQTIQELQQVVRSALAPSDPSSQDQAVAAQAEAEMAQAEAKATQKAASSSASSASGDPGSQDNQSQQGGGQGTDSATSGTSGTANKPALPPIVGPPVFGSARATNKNGPNAGSSSPSTDATFNSSNVSSSGLPPLPASFSSGAPQNARDRGRGQLLNIQV
jgi:SprA-related family